MGRHVNNLNVLEEYSYVLVKPGDLKNKDPEKLSSLAKLFKAGTVLFAPGILSLVAGIAMSVDGRVADAGNWLLYGGIGTIACAISHNFYTNLIRSAEYLKNRNQQANDKQLGANLIDEMMKRIRKNDYDCKDTDPALYTALEMYESIVDLSSVPVDNFNNMIVCLAKYRDLYNKQHSSDREERKFVRLDDLDKSYSEYIKSLQELACDKECPLEAREKFALFASRKKIESTSQIVAKNRSMVPNEPRYALV